MNELENKNTSVAVINKPQLPAARRVARGKGFVTVQDFAESGSSSEIKETLLEVNPDMPKKQLKAKVLETLRGEKDLREQVALAWVQCRFQAGDVPDKGEITSGGSCLRLKNAPEPVIAAAVIPLTREQLLAQIAELQKKADAMKAGQQ